MFMDAYAPVTGEERGSLPPRAAKFMEDEPAGALERIANPLVWATGLGSGPTSSARIVFALSTGTTLRSGGLS